jgi:hypothetical protein
MIEPTYTQLAAIFLPVIIGAVTGAYFTGLRNGRKDRTRQPNRESLQAALIAGQRHFNN